MENSAPEIDYLQLLRSYPIDQVNPTAIPMLELL